MEKSRKSRPWLFFVIAFVLFVGFLFVKKNNVVRWIQSGFTLHQQNKTIEQYTEDIKSMDEQLNMLRSNRDSLETFARENFFYSKPGDDVYLDDK